MKKNAVFPMVTLAATTVAVAVTTVAVTTVAVDLAKVSQPLGAKIGTVP